TSVDSPEKPEALVLGQNHPNPFNPFTSIEYNLPSDGSVRLEIYNTAGQLVDVLANGYRSAGTHMAVWNTGNHPSGVYFYRLRYGGFSEVKKMTLLK
ncbi:T9SS type A sorting domain-containing protein, partial [Candidatus Omnitrophota bacterium]